MDSSESDAENDVTPPNDPEPGSPRYTPPLPEELMIEGPNNEGDNPPAQGSDDDNAEEELFDINLPAEHSYLPSDLIEVCGRSVLEAGWEGRVPCRSHSSCVFPGETVPMMCRHHRDIEAFLEVINKDKLFGLLCPDETGMLVSGYGVLCEIYKTSPIGDQRPNLLSLQSRAIQRFRFVDMPKSSNHINMYMHVVNVNIKILPEILMGDPLENIRLLSLDSMRHPENIRADEKLRKMDAICTPWPLFVYEIFDAQRTTNAIRQYFKGHGFPSLPSELVSLSFWVASNLSLSLRDRIALFTVDNALLRLHMELEHINKKCVLCCSSCVAEITRKEHIFAMSREGLHSNYCNLGGYVHDIVTVSKVTNVAYAGRPSMEFTWFPGYSWTITVCQSCGSHVGWRFRAAKKSLKPQEFWAVCRNLVAPIQDAPGDMTS